MSALSHELDPTADLVLVLKKQNSEPLLPEITSMKLKNAEANQASREGKKPPPGQWFLDLFESEPAYNPSVDLQEHDQQPEVRFKVSSRHLKLASPVFKAMLDGPWMEGSLSDESHRTITTSDWDSQALLIFFNIIHGHHKEVPKSLDLETFCKLAIIVDYYQCHEIVEIFADRWLTTMKSDIPTTYGINSTLCLCVAWVFKWPEEFESMARLALRHGEGPIEASNLPVAGILTTIDEKRQELVGQLQDEIDNLRRQLTRKDICSFECSSILLGALMKEMRSIGEGGKQLRSPYDGDSLEGLFKKLSRLRSPKWNDSLRGDYGYGGNKHSCSLIQKTQPILDRVEKGMGGFKLEDF